MYIIKVLPLYALYVYHMIIWLVQMAFSYVIMQCLPELNMDNFPTTPRIDSIRDLLFGKKRYVGSILRHPASSNPPWSLLGSTLAWLSFSLFILQGNKAVNISPQCLDSRRNFTHHSFVSCSAVYHCNPSGVCISTCPYPACSIFPATERNRVILFCQICKGIQT